MVAFHDNLLPGRGTSHLLLNIIDTSFQCGTSLKGTLCTQQLIIKIESKLCALQFYLTVKSTGYTTSCHLTVRRAENICWFHFYEVQRHAKCFSNNLCDLHNKVKTREPWSYWEDTRYIHSYAPYTCRYDWITRHTHQGGRTPLPWCWFPVLFLLHRAQQPLIHHLHTHWPTLSMEASPKPSHTWGVLLKFLSFSSGYPVKQSTSSGYPIIGTRTHPVELNYLFCPIFNISRSHHI